MRKCEEKLMETLVVEREARVVLDETIDSFGDKPKQRRVKDIFEAYKKLRSAKRLVVEAEQGIKLANFWDNPVGIGVDD